MAQPGTDQHQSRIAVRETANHTSAAADLPVESFNNVVGTDTGPVFTGKIAVSQRFLNAIFYLLGSLFQLHRVQLLHHGFGFLTGSFLVLLGVDRLEHLGHQLHFGTRRHREHIAVKVDRTSLVFGFGEHFSHSLQHTKAFVANNEFHPFQTAAAQPLRTTGRKIRGTPSMVLRASSVNFILSSARSAA